MVIFAVSVVVSCVADSTHPYLIGQCRTELTAQKSPPFLGAGQLEK